MSKEQKSVPVFNFNLTTSEFKPTSNAQAPKPVLSFPVSFNPNTAVEFVPNDFSNGTPTSETVPEKKEEKPVENVVEKKVEKEVVVEKTEPVVEEATVVVEEPVKEEIVDNQENVTNEETEVVNTTQEEVSVPDEETEVVNTTQEEVSVPEKKEETPAENIETPVEIPAATPVENTETPVETPDETDAAAETPTEEVNNKENEENQEEIYIPPQITIDTTNKDSWHKLGCEWTIFYSPKYNKNSNGTWTSVLTELCTITYVCIIIF
eukprot:TRINITY_DN230_c0_g1_i1.p1 TRINITY_DN230_c0_g1~~TRINITY_DN230_c0_g1_i1.p1  ORF type:complete len:266 (+),score=97.76 TRINITY_DN230_c0_g1_i1:23-820(+)